MRTGIVTLTLNPTVDIAADADRVQPTRKIRTRGERFDPGGGGVNVSRVLRELGAETHAIVTAGGAAGTLLIELMDAEQIPHTVVPIADRTRISHTVYARATGEEYRFVAEGPELRHQESTAALATLAATPGDWVVLSGSLPRGVAPSFYARALQAARAAGRRAVLDTSGPSLRAALGNGIALLKPSRGEFAALVGETLRDDAAEDAAALNLVRNGAAELIAMTLGDAGALLAEPGGITRLPALPVRALGAVGAGDSFCAAMTLALARGETPQSAFAWGMAAGAAAVMRPGTAQPRRADIEAFRRRLPPSLPRGLP